MNTEERLADLLGHYLKTAFRRAGAEWNEDNDAEVASMVDLIARIASERAHAEIQETVPEDVLR